MDPYGDTEGRVVCLGSKTETGEFGGYDEMERKRRRDLGLVRGR